jgi:hypothetical protein
MSRGDVLQTSFSRPHSDTRRFSFAFSCSSFFNQSPRLSHLEAAVLLAPTVVRLLHNVSFLACLDHRLPVGYPTSTCRSKFTICSAVCFFPRAIQLLLLLFQFVASQLVQKRRALQTALSNSLDDF